MKRASTKASPGNSARAGRLRDGGTAENSSPQSLTQDAYQRIRIDILEGRLAAGQPLRLEALKERYGLSFSPLREALNRLQSERLVVTTVLRGFRVAEISRLKMWDAIETRILIESEALRRSVTRGGDDWEGSMVAAFHALSRCASRIAAAAGNASEEEIAELEGRHHNFHSALIGACESRWLIELAAQLYAQTERYRRPLLGTKVTAWTSGRDIHREHEAIMKAALARDGKLAAELLSEHYRKTGQLIERQFDDTSAAPSERRPGTRKKRSAAAPAA